MEYKQMIILRKDLNMRKGKMVAQGAHASLKAILDNGTIKKGTFTLKIDENFAAWMNGKFKKVCVSVNSEEELVGLFTAAKRMNLPAALILDSGLTEFNNVPTYTAVAIGPAEEGIIDTLTKDLPLL